MNFFLESKAEELYSIGQEDLTNIKTSILYADIQNNSLRYIFSSLHYLLNIYFDSMNDRHRTQNNHFWAQSSRDLMQLIEIYRELEHYCADTEYDFNTDRSYINHINKCSSFLVSMKGSLLPDNYTPLSIKKYEPIFSSLNIIRQEKSLEKLNLKLIDDSGSYAQVFKYKDSFYNKHIAVKRARSNLTQIEIERFKNEFDVLKKLSSPYIIDVYQYSESNNQYSMEFADDTVYSYISNNPTTSISTRKKLILQILEGFTYIHSKGIFHRDVSFKNILLKHYEDVSIIKISDFGLVKSQDQFVTHSNTEVKGSLNDPALEYEGFKNYTTVHEIYALTKLIIFIMTGKTNLGNIKSSSQMTFMKKGLSPNKRERYQNINELKKIFLNTNW